MKGIHNHAIPLIELDQFDFRVERMEDIEKQRENGQGPHRHAFYTIVFPVSGSGMHTIDFKGYEMAGGQLFFVSPQQVHDVYIDKMDDLKGYVLMFNRGFLLSNGIREDVVEDIRLFGDCSDNRPLVPEEKIHIKLEQIAEEIIERRDYADLYQFESIGALLKLFLIECLRSARDRSDQSHHERFATQSILKRYKEAVEKHFRHWHQVQKYAAELNVTPGYLNEVIRANLNQTAKEYLQSRILLESQRLAVFTDFSAKEVAYEVGYDDPSHFSRFFKTQTRQSFSDWREDNRENDNSAHDFS